MSIKIILTEDGSHSLLDQTLNETYHSTRGAKGESIHVFIKRGLEQWVSKNEKQKIRVLEVGFGSGLNAFLTALWAEEHRKEIHFSSLEPFPVRSEVYENLNYPQSEKEKKLFLRLHESEWGVETSITAFFDFFKTNSRLENFEAPALFDIIYFDAFAPGKQPEVWSGENLKKCFNVLNPNGILTTYCAQGQFKRNLKEAGFEVETLLGAMGKKEMAQGIKK